jgi:asparagine synthase (glutamine-hydrolysing)
MSGIAGIIHFDGAPIEPGQIEKITAAMAHRGPDGIQHWVKGSVALGQCMLRTTPESLEETQPLANEDESLVLVMDGRVDNWEELRKELLGRGAVLRTRADAELVLRAYEVWGRECLAHIDGDFAMVIWDALQKQALCARDRMGNKPFHYHWDGKTLAFASELQPILSLPWVREELNEGMLAEFLAADWHSRDETFWKGVMRLVAAHLMEVGVGGPKPELYWSPNLWETLPYTKDEEFIEHYRELFKDIVRRLSRSHRSLACEVSGGLDSSAIFAIAEHLRRQHQLLSPSIDGYVLDFHDDADANELEYSRSVGKHLGKNIREITPTTMPLSWYRDQAIAYKEFPGFPNGVMALGLRSEARSHGSRVLLTGAGGDEWLGGSHVYYADELASRNWVGLVKCLTADYRVSGFRSTLWWFLRFGLAPLLPAIVKDALRMVVRRDWNDGLDNLEWLTQPMRKIILVRREQYRFSNEIKFRQISQRGKILALTNAYPMLAHESDERLCSGLGLELRRPFWNAKLVQFNFMCPERLHLQGRVNKFLHRRAMAGLLPELVLKRESKAEFSITYRRHLPEMKELLVNQIPSRHPYWVKSQFISKMYDQAMQDSMKSGWAKKRMWNLFGCDALCEKQ